jgi:hypothetical protein
MPSPRRTSSNKNGATLSRGLIYPGHDFSIGVKDTASVRKIQQRLNEIGCGPVSVSGSFDSQTRAAVQLFQARSVDAQGQSLKMDGIVGLLTWGALFGLHTRSSIVNLPVSELLKNSLSVAATQVGVMEEPPGSNRGPRVDEYLRAVGLDPSKDSYPWCAAFVYWSFQQAATRAATVNPVIRTSGVLNHWNKAGQAGVTRLLQNEVLNDFSLLKPGLIFVISTGGGKGHMGIVEDFRDDRLITIEGNTNLPGDREGVGVFRRDGRKLTEINKGFISYDS